MTVYGRTQRVLLTSSARLTTERSSHDDPDARDAAPCVASREPERIARR